MIREDKSYISSLASEAIVRGFAKPDLHSIRLSRRQYTEEEKAENRAQYALLTNEEWTAYCESSKASAAKNIHSCLESLSKIFVIYQYTDDSMSGYRNAWDLFFWCNSLPNSYERDYSYVTLDFNDKKTPEERLADLERIKEFCGSYEGAEEIDIAIQYRVKYDYDKLHGIAEEYHKTVDGEWVTYQSKPGKIIKRADQNGKNEYLFKKKGAKKYCYLLKLETMLSLYLAHERENMVA